MPPIATTPRASRPTISRTPGSCSRCSRQTGLVELTVGAACSPACSSTGSAPQIASVDSLYLRALRARGRVAPSVESSREPEGITGGLVLDSRPGLYRNVLVFDFKSLYPSLIRTFNIDPLTHVPSPAPGADVIRTPGGAAFRRDEHGILPALVARLWDERAAARAAGDATESQAIKILMNSLFGVLGSPASRLFSPAVANAITLAGQHVIRLAAQAVERRGHRVIYGDTDSLFVDASEPDERRAAATAEILRGEVGRRGGGGAGARVRVRQPPRARVREGLHRASSCPRCAAARRAARSGTPACVDGQCWRSSASRRCGATGAVSRGDSSASCSIACSTTSR